MAAGRDLGDVQHICGMVSLAMQTVMTTKYHGSSFYYWLPMYPPFHLRTPLSRPAAHSLVVAGAEPLWEHPSASLRGAFRVQANTSSLVLRLGEGTGEICREWHYLLLLSAVEQRCVRSFSFALPSMPHDTPCKIFLVKCERIVSFRFFSCSFDI